MSSYLEVECAGGALVLSAARAAYCPAERALFVADVHLGKATSFRALGVPVPGGTTAVTLRRLDDVLAAFRPRTLVMLGDLLHGPAVHGTEVVSALRDWRASHHDIEVTLIRGNHDRRAGDPPPDCGVTLADEGLALGNWRLLHAPPDENSDSGPRPMSGTLPAFASGAADSSGGPGDFGLAGHVHPCFRLSGRVDSVRLPAFWLRADHAILPAFGEFTGGWQPRRLRDDRVIITDGEQLREIPPRVEREKVRA